MTVLTLERSRGIYEEGLSISNDLVIWSARRGLLGARHSLQKS